MKPNTEMTPKRRWPKKVAITLLVLLTITAGLAVVAYNKMQFHLTPAEVSPQNPALVWRDMAAIDRANFDTTNNKQTYQYPVIEYNPKELLHPSKEFGPWAWWWWPGADIDAKTLEKHIDKLDKMGFAGFEHEAFSTNTGVVDSKAITEKVMTVGTPAYYEKLRQALDLLHERGMQLDLGESSGWPANGPHVDIARSIPDLVPAEVSVNGGQLIDISLPKPKPNAPDYAFLMGEIALGHELGNFTTEHSKIHTVIAAKIIGGKRSAWPFNLDDQVILDPDNTVVLDDFVKDNQLVWQAPEGKWMIIATYQKPSATLASAMTTAYPGTSYVLNHFDKQEVHRHLEFSFGEETGLKPHFGKAVRGLFIDSPEFPLSLPTNDDIFEEFEQRRGYNLKPLTPALFIEGKHHFFSHITGLKAKPSYVLTEADERIRHDYDLTISELMIDRYIGELTRWSNTRDMHVTGEVFGLEIDTIQAMGRLDIPQTEQLYAGGSDLFLKLASSAGLLYGKPLIAAETFVSVNRDYTFTPRRLKAMADKVFANGINQIHYHGVTYPWQTAVPDSDESVYWYPWSMPSISGDTGGRRMAFTFNATPNNVYWPDLKPLNDYISRSHYLLRQGKPEFQVLIYYPYLGFPSVLGGEGFTQEYLFDAHLPDSDPENLGPKNRQPEPTDKRFNQRMVWLNNVRLMTHELDQQGITWNWLNGHALASNKLQGNRLLDSDAKYQAIVIPDIEAITVNEMEQLITLAKSGVNIHFLGKLPKTTPGYKQFKSQSAQIQTLVAYASALPSVHSHQNDASLLTSLSQQLTTEKLFKEATPARRLTRRLNNQHTIEYINNISNNDITMALQLVQNRDYWLFNAMTGKATALSLQADGSAELALEPFGSRFVISGIKPPTPLLANTKACTATKQSLNISEWTIVDASGNTLLKTDILKDWRELESLKYQGAADYEAEFTLASVSNCSSIDFGLIQGAADIFINGQHIERLAYHPFKSNISKVAKVGKNTLKLRLYPPQRNEFIGKALEGDMRYQHFEPVKDDLAAAGLLGPVTITH